MAMPCDAAQVDTRFGGVVWLLISHSKHLNAIIHRLAERYQPFDKVIFPSDLVKSSDL